MQEQDELDRRVREHAARLAEQRRQDELDARHQWAADTQQARAAFSEAIWREARLGRDDLRALQFLIRDRPFGEGGSPYVWAETRYNGWEFRLHVSQHNYEWTASTQVDLLRSDPGDGFTTVVDWVRDPDEIWAALAAVVEHPYGQALAEHAAFTAEAPPPPPPEQAARDGLKDELGNTGIWGLHRYILGLERRIDALENR